jgi:hypothetical protein
MKRLEEKLLRVKLESLRQVLAAGDPVNIQASLEQLEASGLPVPASHPVWQQAQVARCQLMLRRAEELRQGELWQDVEVVVEEIHAFATRYNVRLPDADADVWNALDEWTTQKRAAYEAQQDFRRAVSALEYEADSLATQRASGAKLNKARAMAAVNSLTAKWMEAERFGEELAEELVVQYKECLAWLRQQIQAANSRRLVIAVVMTLVILGAIGAAVPSAINRVRVSDYKQTLQQLESVRNVSQVESLLAGAPDSLKTNPKMADSLGKARDFVARERGLKQTFDKKLDALKQIATAGFGNELAQVGPDRTSCGHALSLLAPEYQAAGTGELDAWDGRWQTFRNAELGHALNHAEGVAAVLNATNGVEPVRAAIPQVQAILFRLAPLEAQPPALEQGLADRLVRLTNEIDTWTATVGKWEQARAALVGASSLEQYLDALERMLLSPFATTEQKSAVARIKSLQLDQETLLGQLLLPNDRPAWDTLTNVTSWSASLMPEQPTSQEKDLYFKLRDDKNVRDVNAYELITNARPNNPYRTHPVFVQGAIALDNGGSEAGMVHDPALYRDSLHFMHTAYSDWDYSKIKRLYRTLECDSYERLGLGDLIDANTGNYQKPILQIFDQLNQENKASAVFRAFVTFKLLAVAELRPAEWGFPWCPSLAGHIQALTALDAKEIQSGDWMVPERSEKLEGPLQEYFRKARAIPLEKQARFLQQLVRETCLKGFVFAGFIDENGNPVLRPLSAPSVELCGWNRVGTATVLYRKAPGGETYTALTPCLPYSPLFAFAGDRRELLLQTLNATAYPAALAASILPPFFEGAL